MNNAIIESALETVDLSKPETIQEAANLILSGPTGFKAGSTVAVGEDATYPYSGQKGTSRGPSKKGAGYTDVEFPNGVVLPLQTSLLYAVE